MEECEFGFVINSQKKNTASSKNSYQFFDGLERIGGVMNGSPGPDDVKGFIFVREPKHIFPIEFYVLNFELILLTDGLSLWKRRKISQLFFIRGRRRWLPMKPETPVMKTFFARF